MSILDAIYSAFVLQYQSDNLKGNDDINRRQYSGILLNAVVISNIDSFHQGREEHLQVAKAALPIWLRLRLPDDPQSKQPTLCRN